MTTAYVTHSDCSRHDTGWAHPEHQGRLAAVSRAVYRDMLVLFELLREMEGVPATTDDLLLAHDPAYVERVRARVDESARAGEVLPFEGDVRLSGASWAAATAAVGCGITAVDAVLRGEVANAFCAVRPPGHHVGIAAAGGFGVFNTVAVAARHLRERRGVERVLVVEWAAAPGRGTAEIAAGDPGIRFATAHQRGEPGAGEWPAGTVAVPVEPAAGGDEVLHALDRAVDAATADFRPGIILLSLGLDSLAGDPVGGLAVTPAETHALTRAVMARAADLCDGRLVSVLEGGYDAAATGLAVVQHLHALTEIRPA